MKTLVALALAGSCAFAALPAAAMPALDGPVVAGEAPVELASSKGWADRASGRHQIRQYERARMRDRAYRRRGAVRGSNSGGYGGAPAPGEPLPD